MSGRACLEFGTRRTWSARGGKVQSAPSPRAGSARGSTPSAGDGACCDAMRRDETPSFDARTSTGGQQGARRCSRSSCIYRRRCNTRKAVRPTEPCSLLVSAAADAAGGISSNSVSRSGSRQDPLEEAEACADCPRRDRPSGTRAALMSRPARVSVTVVRLKRSARGPRPSADSALQRSAQVRLLRGRKAPVRNRCRKRRLRQAKLRVPSAATSCDRRAQILLRRGRAAADSTNCRCPYHRAFMSSFGATPPAEKRGPARAPGSLPPSGRRRCRRDRPRCP